MNVVNVSYGEYEVDPTRLQRQQILGYPPRQEIITTPRLRRRRFETWRNEIGERYGRWEWENVT